MYVRAISNLICVVVESNKGFKFKAKDEDGLRKKLEENDSFCRDSRQWSECMFHECQYCWREVGRVGQEGLHICLDNQKYPDMHIDFHQIAKGKDENGNCDWSIVGWLEHMADILNLYNSPRFPFPFPF